VPPTIDEYLRAIRPSPAAGPGELNVVKDNEYVGADKLVEIPEPGQKIRLVRSH
jgi:hypothetical protein